MRYLVAILVALVLFAAAPSAQAQSWLLSGDSPTPWGYGWSPSGQYYQPTAAQSYQWASPLYQSYTWPTYPAWSYTPRPSSGLVSQYVDDLNRTDEIRRAVRTELDREPLWR